MPNYKSLFYQSQRALADAIDALEALQAQLKQAMAEAEEGVIHEETAAE